MGAHFVGVTGAVPPVEVRIVGVATDASAEDPASLTVEATGGVVFLDTGAEPYTGTIDWGDGTIDDLVIDSTAASAWNPLTVAHEYADPGDYTVTVMISAPEGGDASATTELSVSDSAGRYQGDVVDYRDVDTETFTITKNRASFAVDGESIEWRKLEVAWTNLYEAVDLQGNKHIADCEGRGGYTLTSADLTVTAKDKIRGTAVLLWAQHDSGPECPFGGIDADRVVTGTVTGSLDGDTITLTYDGVSDDGHPVSFDVKATRR
jgi:hypothetical protein